LNSDLAKQRIIQELVPGKQITLAHIIANPDQAIIDGLAPSGKVSLGKTTSGKTPPGKAATDKASPPAASGSAIGIFTVTPPETAIIIADIAIKSSGVQINSIDRATGSLIVTGAVSAVEAAASAILDYVGEKLGFEICNITKT